jgi:hypothetical protein
MGAMSLVKVGVFGTSAAVAAAGSMSVALSADALKTVFIVRAIVTLVMF